ncbi:hypothetical protein F4823DRAFT_397561 [Ustulina deusta]|nr:hypothetical protein F4823DRAFT_397561 [Ustulina deusta]
MLVLVSYQPIHPLSEFLLATVLTLVTDSSIFFGYWFPEKKFRYQCRNYRGSHGYISLPRLCIRGLFYDSPRPLIPTSLPQYLPVRLVPCTTAHPCTLTLLTVGFLTSGTYYLGGSEALYARHASKLNDRVVPSGRSARNKPGHFEKSYFE